MAFRGPLEWDHVLVEWGETKRRVSFPCWPSSLLLFQREIAFELRDARACAPSCIWQVKDPIFSAWVDLTDLGQLESDDGKHFVRILRPEEVSACFCWYLAGI